MKKFAIAMLSILALLVSGCSNASLRARCELLPPTQQELLNERAYERNFESLVDTWEKEKDQLADVWDEYVESTSSVVSFSDMLFGDVDVLFSKGYGAAMLTTDLSIIFGDDNILKIAIVHFMFTSTDAKNWKIIGLIIEKLDLTFEEDINNGSEF